jgi:alkanesulfonate monooxygenase SsuD/methylene tetrahydromethanopterin reductase-like flavin-dependent oxidoreductase (luciferase family)
MEGSMSGREIKFGVITPQWVSWGEMVRRWELVENLGYDSVWVADHLVNFMEIHTPAFEAWTTLAGLAAHTKRIRCGPLISPIPFHNPAFLAKKAVTVDHLTGGRLEIGLGAGIPGSYDPSYSMSSTDDWPGNERVGRLGEAVEIIDMLLRNEVSTYEGNYYQIKEAVMHPRPVQQPRPPITIGANGPLMRKLAARWADTWSIVWTLYPLSDESLKDLSELNQSTSEFCEAIGRDPASLRRSVLHFHPDPGMEFAFNSVHIFTEVIESVIDVGFNEIILQYPYRETELPLFEKVSFEVLPRLRS